jgi:predicted nucleotidyltransferase
MAADTEESDLDLLVDPGRSTSLPTIAGFKIDAEKLPGVSVSVVTPNGLPPKFRNQVLQQAQPCEASGTNRRLSGTHRRSN